MTTKQKLRSTLQQLTRAANKAAMLQPAASANRPEEIQVWDDLYQSINAAQEVLNKAP